MTQSMRQLGRVRAIIGNEDVTQYVDDGMTWSNVDPGGFEACSMQFPRDMPDLVRGQYVRIDCGLHVAFEGRVSQVQRSLGHRTTINGEGYGALFKDQVGSEIFIDRDLTHWAPWSISRQINVINAGHDTNIFSWQIGNDPTNLKPGLIISGQGPLSSKPLTEVWYDAGPFNNVGRVRLHDGQAIGYAEFFLNELGLFTSSDDIATTVDFDAFIQNVTFSRDWTVPTPRRYTLIQHEVQVPAASQYGANNGYGYALSNLSVLGNHGLTLRGSAPTDGFYPSDIFSWVVSQVPGLQTGIVQDTDASGYVVPHSVYYTPTALDSIVNDMAVAQGWHWGVWEARSLTGGQHPAADFRPRRIPGSPNAFCYRQDCDTVDIREDLSQQYNQAKVSYTDVTGKPGAVTVTVDNPILNEAGISSRTVEFSAGTMTAATAQVFGAEALTILNIQQRVAGSADIISPIATSYGFGHPGLLRAGIDRLRIADLPSTTAFGATSDFPINRVECSTGSGGTTAIVEFGSGGNLIETLQARLASATALAAQGG